MLLTIILIFLAFFYEIFLLSKGFFLGDNLLVIVPHKIFILESLKKGVLPLWNPNMWAGFPEVADITLGLFNPFNLIHFVFPGLLGVNMVALVAYFIALIGTYVFLKNEGLRRQAALLGGIIFTFSGSMVNISLDIIRLESICFLPWTLLFFRRKKYFITILLLALNFLVGQTQHFYMAILFIFGFLIFFLEKQDIIKKIFIFSLCIAVSLLLTAFALLPQLQLMALSSRASAGLEYNTIWSLNPLSLIRFFFADFWGRRNEGSFWGPNLTYSFGYAGFFTLVFIIAGLKKISRKSVYFLGAALITLLISFGKFNPLHRIFFIIPGFSFFRNPSSWLVIYSFSLACLAAFIANKTAFAQLKRLKKTVLIAAFGLSLVGLLLLIIWQFFPDLPNQSLIIFARLISKNLSAFHTPAVDRQIVFLIARNLLILGLLSLLFTKKFSHGFLIIIIFADLFFFSKGDLFLAPKMTNIFNELKRKSHIQYLQEDVNNYRFVSTAEFMPVRGMSIYMGDYFKRPPFIQKDYWLLTIEELKTFSRFKQIFELLPPDIFVGLNLPSINGYSTFRLKNYSDFFSTPSAELSASAKRVLEVRLQNKDVADPTRINFDIINFDDPRLSELSVKYLLADEKLELKNFSPVFDNGQYIIYENKNVLPRAQVLNKDGPTNGGLKIVDTNTNTVEIKFSNYNFKEGDYLLLRDTYYPGWQVFDQNGNKLELQQEEIFRKVELNDKIKTLVFKFKPADFYLGLKISLITLFCLLLFKIYKVFF